MRVKIRNDHALGTRLMVSLQSVHVSDNLFFFLGGVLLAATSSLLLWFGISLAVQASFKNTLLILIVFGSLAFPCLAAGVYLIGAVPLRPMRRQLSVDPEAGQITIELRYLFCKVRVGVPSRSVSRCAWVTNNKGTENEVEHFQLTLCDGRELGLRCKLDDALAFAQACGCLLIPLEVHNVWADIDGPTPNTWSARSWQSQLRGP